MLLVYTCCWCFWRWPILPTPHGRCNYVMLCVYSVAFGLSDWSLCDFLTNQWPRYMLTEKSRRMFAPRSNTRWYSSLCVVRRSLLQTPIIVTMSLCQRSTPWSRWRRRRLITRATPLRRRRRRPATAPACRTCSQDHQHCLAERRTCLASGDERNCVSCARKKTDADV